jgi:ATP-dependent DNA ligase
MPVFDLLRTGPRAKTDVALFAFDLLELNGEDLRREPIEARKARLTKLLRHSDPNVRHPGRPAFQSGADTTGAIQVVDHIEEDGSTVFAHACQLGYEGIVSKRHGSRYESGRSSHWLKTKNPNHRRCCGCPRRIGMADRQSVTSAAILPWGNDSAITQTASALHEVRQGYDW